MVNIALLRDLGITEENVDQQVNETFVVEYDGMQLSQLMEQVGAAFSNGTILKGKIVNIHGDDVVVEIGLKSEGVLSLQREWDPEEQGDVEVGDEITVLLEQVESDAGMVMISKRKADRITGWNKIIESKKEG